MHRLYLCLALAAALLAGAAFHRADAAGELGDFINICHANGSGSPGVFDLTGTMEQSGSTTAWRSVITYYPGKKMRVRSETVATHLAHGDSVWHVTLDDTTKAYLTTLEDIQDYVLDLGYVRITADYENVNMVPGNSDCYWYTTEFTTL